MTEFAFRSATELVADLKAGRTSSRALLELYLQRIDRYNPPLNAVICERRDRARQRADAADTALRQGQDWGPLHGLSIGVQIIGSLYGDLRTIQLAQWLHKRGFGKAFRSNSHLLFHPDFFSV